MRIGILTGGGDAPGLNAAIRAVVLRATALGHETFGIGDGWAGLLGEAAPRVLVARDVAAILGEGGTILGTSRTDPRKDDASRRAVLDGIRRFRLDALVAVGGNDTLGVAQWLHEQGVAVVGVPKTVDNDLAETDFCIGFDTAVTVVADALDRLRTTASAHHRRRPSSRDALWERRGRPGDRRTLRRASGAAWRPHRGRHARGRAPRAARALGRHHRARPPFRGDPRLGGSRARSRFSGPWIHWSSQIAATPTMANSVKI